jgi:hypothetical protein
MVKRVNNLCVLIVFLLLVPQVIARAQGETDRCAVPVNAALESALAACDTVGLDQVCIGYHTVESTLRQGAAGMAFASVGDTIDAVELTDLRLRGLDGGAETWGIVHMRLTADLPDGQAVQLIALGDAQITPGEPVPPLFGVNVSGTVNVREGPSTRANVIGQISGGQSVVTDGRLADSSWLRVQWNGGYAWVFASLVSPMGDIAALDVVDPNAPLVIYGPMQAFYTTTRSDTAACEDTAQHGLLLQSPGEAAALLLINETEVRVGGTAWVQAPAGESLRLCVVDGWASVSAMDAAGLVFGGSCVSVPLSEERVPAGRPASPEAFDAAAVEPLLALVDRPVTAAIPLDAESLALLPMIPQSGQWAVVYGEARLQCGEDFGGVVDMSGSNGPLAVAFALDGTTAAVVDRRGDSLAQLTRATPHSFDGTWPVGDVLTTARLTLIDSTNLTGMVQYLTPNDRCMVMAPFSLQFGG